MAKSATHEEESAVSPELRIPSPPRGTSADKRTKRSFFIWRPSTTIAIGIPMTSLQREASSALLGRQHKLDK